LNNFSEIFSRRDAEELGIFNHEHHERHELAVCYLSFVRVGLCGSWFNSSFEEGVPVTEFTPKTIVQL
jgi:hypothetical protein